MLTRFISNKDSYNYQVAKQMSHDSPVYTTQQQLYSFGGNNLEARNVCTNKKRKARFKDSSGEMLIHPLFTIEQHRIDFTETVLFSWPYFVELESVDPEDEITPPYNIVKSAGKITPISNNFNWVTIPYTNIEVHFKNILNTERVERYTRELHIPENYEEILLQPNLWLIYGGVEPLETFALLEIGEDDGFYCNLWEPDRRGPTPSPRKYAACCGTDGMALIHGGQLEDDTVLSDLWVFKTVPTSRPWISNRMQRLDLVSYEVMVSEMNTPRFDHFINVSGRTLIACGGKDAKFQDVLTVELLDLDTLIWSTCKFSGPEFPTSLYYTECTSFVMGSTMFVYAGHYGDEIRVAENLSKYQTKADQQLYIWILDISTAHSQVVFHANKKMTNSCEVGLLSTGLIFEIQDGNAMTLNRVAPGNIYCIPQLPPIGAGLSLALEALLKSETKSDITITVGSDQIRVHKLCLGARKDESSGLLDQLSPEGAINLTGRTTYPVAYAAIYYLYTDTIKVPESQPAEEFWQMLLEFAEQFRMLTLKLYCVLALEQGCQFWGSSSSIYSDYRELYKLLSMDVQEGFNAQLVTPDFTLICDNQEFPCHRLLLILHSSYLRALLHHTPDKSSAHLDNISKTSLPYVLQYIYYDSRDIPDSDLYDVFVAAQNLGILALFEICQREISLKIVPKNFCMIYEAALLLGAQSLLDYCSNWAQQFSFLLRKIKIGPETVKLLDTFEKPAPKPKRVQIDVNSLSEDQHWEISREHLAKHPLPSAFDNHTPPGLAPVNTITPHVDLLQQLQHYQSTSNLEVDSHIVMPVLTPSSSIEAAEEMYNPFECLEQEAYSSEEEEEKTPS